MKRWFVLSSAAFAAVMISLMTSVSVFAQDGGAKNAVSLDLGPTLTGLRYSGNNVNYPGNDGFVFGLGASYERLIVPHFSIGGSVVFYAGNHDLSDDLVYFSLAAHGRWYPLSESLEKLFLDAGFGFNALSWDGATFLGQDDDIAGLTFGLNAGWKLLFKGKFFVEPSLGYLIAKSNPLPLDTTGDWQIGFKLGLVF
jgi:hypothetical protein